MPGVLFEVVSAVAEFVRDARLRRNLCIVIWCKSGRHRSVAVATYLAYHFRQHFRMVQQSTSWYVRAPVATCSGEGFKLFRRWGGR
eukprot:2293774-Amphidinium_carterae.1